MIQYGVKIGSSEAQGRNRFNIVVMGSSKIGKTKFIRSILKLEGAFGGPHGKDTEIENMFEYRENITDQLIPGISSAPPPRGRAINTGNVFILIFSVSDLESFIFADILRRDIIEKKGKDVPIMFVGLKSAHARDNAFNGSHGFSLFADVVFDFEESYYFELSLSDEDVLRNIYNEIILLQDDFHATMKRQTNFRVIATNYLRKLVPDKNTICNKVAIFSR